MGGKTRIRLFAFKFGCLRIFAIIMLFALLVGMHKVEKIRTAGVQPKQKSSREGCSERGEGISNVERRAVLDRGCAELGGFGLSAGEGARLLVGYARRSGTVSPPP
ncbi:MAG: hypothetical protein E7549_00535 [Ruminococcaceae bacterium]|nr:hypothetical protein [Oscillospiraceae bacterium]